MEIARGMGQSHGRYCPWLQEGRLCLERGWSSGPSLRVRAGRREAHANVEGSKRVGQGPEPPHCPSSPRPRPRGAGVDAWERQGACRLPPLALFFREGGRYLPGQVPPVASGTPPPGESRSGRRPPPRSALRTAPLFSFFLHLFSAVSLPFPWPPSPPGQARLLGGRHVGGDGAIGVG